TRRAAAGAAAAAPAAAVVAAAVVAAVVAAVGIAAARTRAAVDARGLRVTTRAREDQHQQRLRRRVHFQARHQKLPTTPTPARSATAYGSTKIRRVADALFAVVSGPRS